MNILTFDIEEWYLERKLYGGRDFRYQMFDETFAVLLDELDKHRIKATFFCVGNLAVSFPEVVKTIAGRGHEVGCHSNEHTWLNKMTEQELRKDTVEALKALEDVAGQSVTSYRAPAFSITHNNKWAVNILSDCGIKSDASIFPTSRDFGGYKGFPQDEPCKINHEGSQLKEYPISLTHFLGKTLAYSGGGYFRLLPYSLVNRTITKREYNMCYFHLNDLISQKIKMKSKKEYEEYFKEPGTLKNRLVRYMKSNIGTGDAFGKLNKLLEEQEFMSVRDADRIINWNQVKTIQL